MFVPGDQNNVLQAPNGKTRFDAEVEINDAPIICRDILTKNLSQDEVSYSYADGVNHLYGLVVCL